MKSNQTRLRFSRKQKADDAETKTEIENGNYVSTSTVNTLKTSKVVDNSSKTKNNKTKY